MTLDLRLKQQLVRWYPLIEHDVQRHLVEDNIRFKVVPAGRRSGKTERFKRFMAKTCMSTPNQLYFIAAPTGAQVEKIYWKDMQDLSLTCLHERPPSQTKKIIFFNNGTELHFCSLDKPDRIEGTSWDGGGIDEFASTKPDAWSNLSPLFDTVNPLHPDRRPWCWFLGVPDGLNHYYKMCEKAKTLDDWEVYAWPSSDILPADVIEAAKSRLSPKQYRQEYEASFETVSGKIYEDYSEANYTDATIENHEQLCYFCDFNYTPMSHGIGVVRGSDVYLLDEIILTSAVGQHNALEFVERYKNHKNKALLLYGDRSGRNGEKHGLETEYLTMERVFREHGWTVERRVKNANPAIKDRQNAVRAKICNASGEHSLFVNIKNAPWCHEGLATVQLKEGSSFQEDDRNDYQHITTAIGYFIDYEYPIDEEIVDLNICMWGENINIIDL